MTTLDNLRKTAKRWLKALRRGDPAALDRLRRAHPGAPPVPMLRDVQHALARERGFAGWQDLKANVAARSPDTGLAGLLAAADRGDAAAVSAILVTDPGIINERGPLPGRAGSRTALHFAVHHSAVVEHLLARGADPNVEDAAGLTPLDQAALVGEQDAVRSLMAGGADIRLPSAILLGRTDDLDRLLRSNPDLQSNNRLWARLLVRASSEGSADTVDALLRAARRHRAGLTIVNMEDDQETAIDRASGYTPLHAAAAFGNTAAAVVLLRHGANPRVRDGKYCATPAGWARVRGHTATADLIVDADIDIFDAIDADRGDRVAEVLDADPEAIDRPFKAYASCPDREDGSWPTPGCVPLEWAALQRKENARRVLVERGAAARTTADLDRAERVVSFLRSACWDHHVHGKRDHRMHDRAAQRLLARDPALARANIHTAVACGELHEVERIVGSHPQAALTRGGPRNWTPLLTLCYTRFTHHSTYENALAIARLLLDRGANPNDFYMAMDAVYSALVGVAGEGEQDAPRQPYAKELVELLLERGADPFDVQVVYNTHFSGDMLWWLELAYKHTVDTPRGAAWKDPEWAMFDMGGYGSGARFFLELAIRKRNLQLAEWVLAHGAGPNAGPARDRRYPKTTLYQEAMRQGLPEIADLLRRYGARVAEANLTDRERLTPACLRMDRDEVENLLRRNPDFRELPDPMFAAAEQDRADVVAMLLDIGMSPDVRDANNERPLHRAAANNALSVARLLLDRGAAVDPRDQRYRATPLGWASHGDHDAMVALLCRVSRDFLMLCFAGCVDRVRELLAEDPSPAMQVDDNGVTPLWWLPEDEGAALDIAEALLKAGADPTVKRSDGRTAADWAQRRGLSAVAARLAAARG